MTNKRIENMLSTRGPGHLDLDPAVVEGAVVEIIGGAFRGQTALVSEIERRRQEVTVELFEAAVPVPRTVRADQIELKLEPGCMVKIDTGDLGRIGGLFVGLVGRVIAVNHEDSMVKVRIYDSEVMEIVIVGLAPTVARRSQFLKHLEVLYPSLFHTTLQNHLEAMYQSRFPIQHPGLQPYLDIDLSTACIKITHCLTSALRVYCRYCDRLQGEGPRRFCEKHEQDIEAIYKFLNEGVEEE